VSNTPFMHIFIHTSLAGISFDSVAEFTCCSKTLMIYSACMYLIALINDVLAVEENFALLPLHGKVFIESSKFIKIAHCHNYLLVISNL